MKAKAAALATLMKRVLAIYGASMHSVARIRAKAYLQICCIAFLTRDAMRHCSTDKEIGVISSVRVRR